MDEIEARSKAVSAATDLARSSPGPASAVPAPSDPAPQYLYIKNYGAGPTSFHCTDPIKIQAKLKDPIALAFHRVEEASAQAREAARAKKNRARAAQQPAAAAPAPAPVSTPQTDGPAFQSCPPGSSPSAGAAADATARFEAARRRLYSADGVPGFLTTAADELRARHPGVPFLDHAWGQARCRLR